MLTSRDITTYADEHPGFWEALAGRLVEHYNATCREILTSPATTIERHHYRMGYLHGLRWIVKEAEDMGKPRNGDDG